MYINLLLLYWADFYLPNFVTGPVKAHSEKSIQLVRTGPAMA